MPPAAMPPTPAASLVTVSPAICPEPRRRRPSPVVPLCLRRPRRLEPVLDSINGVIPGVRSGPFVFSASALPLPGSSTAMPASPKSRIDVLLVERGLVPSRERARALILAGRVLVNEQKIDKPGASIGDDAVLRLLGDDLPYV